MAGTANPIDTPNTGNTWLDAILWGKEWSSGASGPTVVSTYIGGQGGNEWVNDGYGDTLRAYMPSAREVAAMNAAMASFEAVCNLDFRMVGSQAAADLVWASADSEGADGERTLGWANPPGEGWVNGEAQSIVVVNHELYNPESGSGSLVWGGYDANTFTHELGHAVGLAHPHDDGGGSTLFPGVDYGDDQDRGNLDMNQGIWTMMSYVDGWQTAPHGSTPSTSWGYQAGPMAFDIAALQLLYGKNMATGAGDDTYSLPEANAIGTYYSCIWDAGGIDWMEGAANRANTIDLRAATLQMAPGGAGWVSYAKGIHGGFTIAKGAVIENAQGGNLADSLRGNGAANILEGRAGNDVLRGMGGNDDLVGGGGMDKMTGGAGADWFIFEKHSDSVVGDLCDEINGFTRGEDRIVLTGVDANGGWAGNGTFRLDTDGSFSRGEIRQTVNADGNLSIRMNIDGDSAAEMEIWLWDQSSRLGRDDFSL